MKVSVIIPTYNYAGFITEAIESIVRQDYPLEDIEIIVVDDGSTDETDFVISSLQTTYNIEYHKQPNLGKAAATRKGIEMATGELIFNLDADDWFATNKIRFTVNLLKGNPGLIHIATPAMIYYQDGSQPPQPEPVNPHLLGRANRGHQLLRYFMEHKLLFGGGSTFAARADILKRIPIPDEVDMYTDEWLLIQTLLKGYSYILPMPLSFWRVHGTNYSAGTPLAGTAKQKRMESSSAFIAASLATGDYPSWLKRTYRLKHEVRKMIWLEEAGGKGFGDILSFFVNGILSGNPLRVLGNYHAFHRLLPAGIKKMLR